MAAGILDGRDEPILIACPVASDKGVTIRSKPQTLAYQIHLIPLWDQSYILFGGRPENTVEAVLHRCERAREQREQIPGTRVHSFRERKEVSSP